MIFDRCVRLIWHLTLTTRQSPSLMFVLLIHGLSPYHLIRTNT